MLDFMRTAIYARVSTKDKGQDVESQLAQLRTFCVANNWTVINKGEYIDKKTGKTANRDEFIRLYKDASQRKFDVVLFWSLDRFSREGVLETLQHLQRLTSYGVGYRSFTEQYLDSCGVFKDAVLSILATIAKQERIRLSERTIAGLERAKRQGRVGGRPKLNLPSYVIAHILDMHIAGHSIRTIAREVDMSVASVGRIVKPVNEDDLPGSKRVGPRVFLIDKETLDESEGGKR